MLAPYKQEVARSSREPPIIGRRLRKRTNGHRKLRQALVARAFGRYLDQAHPALISADRSAATPPRHAALRGAVVGFTSINSGPT
jgi:hypothetical protein